MSASVRMQWSTRYTRFFLGVMKGPRNGILSACKAESALSSLSLLTTELELDINGPADSCRKRRLTAVGKTRVTALRHVSTCLNHAEPAYARLLLRI